MGYNVYKASCLECKENVNKMEGYLIKISTSWKVLCKKCKFPNSMTEEKILSILKSKKIFEVSWRYRDEYILKITKKLIEKKLIKKAKGKPGKYYFKLIENPELLESK